MRAKDKYLERIKFFCIFFLIFFSFDLSAIEIKEKLKKHNLELKNLSVRFIQNDGISVEEGVIYISNNRLKVDYLKPSNISIIMSKKKGMYVDHTLREVQFFNTKKSFVKIFLSLFLENNYLDDTNIIINKNTVKVKKNFFIDTKKHEVDLLYEFRPIKLKKIKVHIDEGYLEIAFFNYQKNIVFSKTFFSLISPYL
jgi:outer membrane lipoprotein-sorting protein